MESKLIGGSNHGQSIEVPPGLDTYIVMDERGHRVEYQRRWYVAADRQAYAVFARAVLSSEEFNALVRVEAGKIQVPQPAAPT